MSPPPHAVLSAVVDAYRASGDPVAAATVADALDVPEPAIAEPLTSLCDCELLARTDGGYRPTITARELLALDIDPEDVLVLDVVEE
jgi:predicted transcriptional regulator